MKYAWCLLELERRESLSQRGVFLLPALRKDNALRENLVHQKRRQLIDEGVPRENIAIRNLELLNDGVKVPIDMPEDIPAIIKGFQLGFISILQLNTRSLVNFEKRTKLSNLI